MDGRVVLMVVVVVMMVMVMIMIRMLVMSCLTRAFHSSGVGVMGRAEESCSFLVVCCSSGEMRSQRLRQM